MNTEKNTINIVISSWPSSGGTTLALMLANIFNLKYIYAGGVIKEWSNRMGYDSSSNRFHEWEMKYGDEWDHMWENYIAIKLSTQENFLCEGKTAGFLLPEGRAFEVMVIADIEIRRERSGKDNRTEEIKNRDELLVNRWQRLFDVNFMDMDSIEENYDVILDNSEMTISQSLETLVSLILTENQHYKLNLTSQQIKEIAKAYDEKYWELNKKLGSGKEFLKDDLLKKGLYMSPEIIFKEWKEDEAYSEIYEGLPGEMREVL